MTPLRHPARARRPFFFPLLGSFAVAVLCACRPANPAASPPRQLLDQAFSTWAASTNRAEVLAGLQALTRALAPKPASDTVPALQDELRSGRDRTLPFDFALAEGGLLKVAPTWRVVLLDLLFRASPAAAAATAELVFSEPKRSADEWALCLRNVAFADFSQRGTERVTARFEEMIQHAPWQTDPSTGFLEAFDIVVYARAVRLVPLLARLMQPSASRTLNHAAFLTLDRLVLAAPELTLPALLDSWPALDARPEARAGYYARANVADPIQRHALRRYLSDPRLSPHERTHFLALFPNYNFFTSRNLLTDVPLPDASERAVRNKAALQTFAAWRRDAILPLTDAEWAALQARLTP